MVAHAYVGLASTDWFGAILVTFNYIVLNCARSRVSAICLICEVVCRIACVASMLDCKLVLAWLGRARDDLVLIQVKGRLTKDIRHARRRHSRHMGRFRLWMGLNLSTIDSFSTLQMDSWTWLCLRALPVLGHLLILIRLVRRLALLLHWHAILWVTYQAKPIHDLSLHCTTSSKSTNYLLASNQWRMMLPWGKCLRLLRWPRSKRLGMHVAWTTSDGGPFPRLVSWGHLRLSSVLRSCGSFSWNTFHSIVFFHFGYRDGSL